MVARKSDGLSLSADRGFEERSHMPVQSESMPQKSVQSSIHLVDRSENTTGFPKIATSIQPARRMESLWPAHPQPVLISRRRPSPRQGRGLEALAHAVEYLLDSRLTLIPPLGPSADEEAVHLLKRLSRAIFDECAECLTLWQRMERACRPPQGRRQQG
jgi:hypothetical protein